MREELLKVPKIVAEKLKLKIVSLIVKTSRAAEDVCVCVCVMKKREDFFFTRFDKGNAHLFPLTEPSFLPSGSSSSTPYHSPPAKSVGP